MGEMVRGVIQGQYVFMEEELRNRGKNKNNSIHFLTQDFFLSLINICYWCKIIEIKAVS